MVSFYNICELCRALEVSRSGYYAWQRRCPGSRAEQNKLLRSRLEKLFSGSMPWGRTVHDVEELDAEFDKEEVMTSLRQKLEKGDVDVRVMQLGPNGSLVDVSDKVGPKDLRPENFAGIQTEDGRVLMGPTGLGPSPRSQETALRLLEQILPGFKISNSGKDSTTNSVRRMEAALLESDKILEHWKK